MTEESIMVDDQKMVGEEVAVMVEVGVVVVVVKEITEVEVVVVEMREAKVGLQEENQEAMVENPLEQGATQCK